MVNEIFQLFNEIEPPYPDGLRLFLVRDKQYLYINKGNKEALDSASIYGIFNFQTVERGKILDSYTKIDFLIAELIRLKIIGFEFEVNMKLLDLISRFTLGVRIGILREWGIIDENLKRELKPLVDVRNSLAHKFSEKEVTYNGQFLTDWKVLRSFSENLFKIWQKLVEIYSIEQEKINIEELKKNLSQYHKNNF